MESSKDTIERDIILPASLERVWAAITQPHQLGKWFGTKAEFKQLRVGEPMLIGWDENIFRGRIEAVEPMTHFAYRWNSGKVDMTTPFDEMPTTLVDFRLEQVDGGARLILVESGFAALPAHLRGPIWQENDSGWNAELADLTAYLQQPEGA